MIRTMLCIYVYMHIYIYIYVCMYIYIERERDINFVCFLSTHLNMYIDMFKHAAKSADAKTLSRLHANPFPDERQARGLPFRTDLFET